MSNKQNVSEELIYELAAAYDDLPASTRRMKNSMYKVLFKLENADNPYFLANEKKFIEDNFRGRLYYIAEMLDENYGIEMTTRQIKAVLIQEKARAELRAAEHDARIKMAVEDAIGKMLIGTTNSDQAVYIPIGTITAASDSYVIVDSHGKEIMYNSDTIFDLVKNHHMLILDLAD